MRLQGKVFTALINRATHGGACRLVLVGLLALGLAACASPGARQAEIEAQQEAARVAAEQESARIALEQQRARERQMQQRRQEEAAELARIQAQREREAAAAQARAEAERQAREEREEAERLERERQEAIAAREQEREEKLARIAELEAEIADVRAQTGQSEDTARVLEEAIVVAEELLDLLAAEQSKYDNTDAQGNTVEPLSKDLIAELEERREDLRSQLD